jgi:hypothetical protein
MASSNSIYGLPEKAKKVGDYNGFDIYYDSSTGKYWELRGGGVGGIEASSSATQTYSSKFGSTATIVPPEKISLNIQTPAAKEKSKSLRYPKNISDNKSDYVLFSFYNYAPPFGSNSRATNGALPSRNNEEFISYSNYSSSSDRSYQNPSTVIPPIILYMPEDIQTQFGAGWNNAGFGASAAGLLNVAGSLGPGQDIMQKLQAGIEAIPGTLKATAFQGIVSGINAAAGANISINQALGTVTGTILNPNVELAYEAPKLRNFSLKFKMTPRTGEESLEIRRICNAFKKAMLPSFGGDAIFGAFQAGNLLTVPLLCQVNFMDGTKVHEFLPQYKLCGITDVSINYTAAGAYATFGDSSPVATELTISFLESKLVFSDEVNLEGGGI